ncbi:MAG: hypothetical protein IPG63_17760 [Xanthomonadales bacterium]|nr:hypothetical protein [Xanthomonadales bacterium]
MSFELVSLFNIASIADASYVEFNFDGVPHGYGLGIFALRQQLVDSGRFTESQAQAFAEEWEVLSQYSNESLLRGTGFSGALFRNRLHPEIVVFGLRGTQDLLDLVMADGVQLVGEGLAHDQAMDMYNYWMRLQAPLGADVPQLRLVEITEDDPNFDASRVIRVLDKAAMWSIRSTNNPVFQGRQAAPVSVL